VQHVRQELALANTRLDALTNVVCVGNADAPNLPFLEPVESGLLFNNNANPTMTGCADLRDLKMHH
jgi:hypothetical protein